MKKYLFIITLIYQSCVPPVAPTNSYDIAPYDNINAYKYAKILAHSPLYDKDEKYSNILSLVKRYLIPILNEKKLYLDQPSYAFIFSWHIKDEIIINLRKK